MKDDKYLGRIAYEAAADCTACLQPWSEANQPKWQAAAEAVRQHDRERLRETMKKRKDEEHESEDPEWPASSQIRQTFDYACDQMIETVDEVLT